MLVLEGDFLRLLVEVKSSFALLVAAAVVHHVLGSTVSVVGVICLSATVHFDHIVVRKHASGWILHGVHLGSKEYGRGTSRHRPALPDSHLLSIITHQSLLRGFGLSPSSVPERDQRRQLCRPSRRPPPKLPLTPKPPSITSSRSPCSQPPRRSLDFSHRNGLKRWSSC